MDQHFDWQSYLNTTAYARYPEASYRPVIGITGNYGEQLCKIAETYYKSVWRAGGVPVIIPPLGDTDVIINTLERIDALILSGGGDYDPHYAGEEPSPKLGTINAERDLPELLIAQLAYNRQIPILGICRGIQTLAMALGGHVRQDISDIQQLNHSQEEDRSVATHTVFVEQGSTLFNIYHGSEFIPFHLSLIPFHLSLIPFHLSLIPLKVNSFHHQAVDDAGKRFRVVARSEDGIIEAMESTEYKSIIGVQWHPECLEDGLPIFRWLVAEATQYRAACHLHLRILTLDTHCDTPMFFPQGINFACRDPKILVDLHKMSEGHQDATIMVAYIPQKDPLPSLGHHSLGSPRGSEGPKAYADNIFDKIETIVADNSDYVRIARTPADLWTNKQAGRKSIMLGIENGRAIEGSLDNLRHFAERGIVYMTLCHNGDNDICDSARGTQTHGGVSAFGREVIREMNRLGIMVDLSHAAESSFYDALELSETPIVCSHSSCRALCDHPRNLTDEQMRALAQKGGVMQVTLYNGFLVKDGEATIEDAMRHLQHAIDVMGIDNVGLGTDFDGDGGIRGLESSSELLHFTQQLLQRGYSEEDIQKLWGGNFLRVMEEVQKVKR